MRPARLALLLAPLLLAACSSEKEPKPAPPADLAYTTNPAAYRAGVAIAPNVLSNGGGPVPSYSLTPALPEGLMFDTVTGVVTGTPVWASEPTPYTVTAVNAGGEATVVLIIGVGASRTRVSVSLAGDPLAGATVVASAGIDESAVPPVPTGIVDTQGTNGFGQSVFSVPATTSTGNLCFSSLLAIPGGWDFASSCSSLDAVPVAIALAHP